MKSRKIIGFLVVLIVLVSSAFTVLAEDSVVIDKTLKNDGEVVLSAVESLEKGSISIKLGDTAKNLPKENVEFSVSKVADVVNGAFVIDESLKDTKVDLNNIKNANDLDIASEELSKVVKKGESVKTDKDGKALVDNLEVGVYLLYAEDIAGYEEITPFMVSMPTWSEEDGVMVYDVEIEPKHTPLPEAPKAPEVPQTGYESDYHLYLITSFVLLLSGCLVLVGLKKVKDRKSSRNV